MKISDEDNCLICIDDCNTILNCNHHYHAECLTTWFKLNKHTKIVCCYCKTPLNAQEVKIIIKPLKRPNILYYFSEFLYIIHAFARNCLNV